MFCCGFPCPKDTAILKTNNTVMLIHYGGGKTIRRCSKTLPQGLRNYLVFPGTIHRKSPQMVSCYGDSKVLVFSTWLGPLGAFFQAKSKKEGHLQPRPPLTGVSWAWRARNPEKVSRNSLETVSKQSPESQNRLFPADSGDCFQTVSGTFSTPGPEGRETLWRLFRDSWPGGPGRLP